MTRARFLTLCAAAFGLAISISLLPLWMQPAPAGQAPGYMTAHDLDARASYRFLFSLFVLPLGVAFAMRPAIGRLVEGRRWASNGAAAAMLGACWISLITPRWTWVVLPALAAIAACLLLRRFDARFSRADVVLLPTVATVWIALLDRTPKGPDQVLALAVLIVLAVRLAVAWMPRDLPPALCFALAPLALVLQTPFFARDERHAGWPSLLIALLTPFAMRLFVRDSPLARKRLRIALAFAIYPIAAYGYASATSVFSTEGKVRVDFFEDMQHAVPASEMLRGEKPYRDVIPPHGLIQDALFDYAALKSGPVTMGRALKVRGLVTGLHAVLIYALTAAATGSAELGILTFFLAIPFNAAGGPVRSLPALATLTVLASALRRRNPRAFFWAGVLFVIAGLTSLDYAFYALIALLWAALRCARRWEALRWAAIGAVAAGIPVAIALAAYGILFDLFRVTFGEIATWGPAYALTPFGAPEGLQRFRFLPEAILGAFDKSSYVHVLWTLTLLGFAAALGFGIRSKGRRRALSEAMLVLAVFIIICGLSYAERQHHKYLNAVPPLAVAVTWRLFRARSAQLRVFGPLLAVALVMIAQPTYHIAIAASLRRVHGPLEAQWVEIDDVPRATGALFRQTDADVVRAAQRYVATLGPDDTFFDFTNRGLLYFLLDRDMPVRQVEVAFYESEKLQREVIAAIERNPHVRAALVPANDGANAVDGVPNRDRAPLVWQYLETHFEPDRTEGELVFWRRKQ
ncbi:MAG: hypothetical protein JOZ54_15955 [Acidobacteria bacterium]|nr:hypothetical protein [Acidobacteriota bacterium]